MASSRNLWWLLAALGLAGAVVLYRFHPSQHGFYPQCTFHALTGFQCPGCGGLRCLHHLLHGEVATAFRFNPMVVLLLPTLAGWLGWAWWQRRQGRASAAQVQPRWIWIGFGVVLLFAIARNLPFAAMALPVQ